MTVHVSLTRHLTLLLLLLSLLLQLILLSSSPSSSSSPPLPKPLLLLLLLLLIIIIIIISYYNNNIDHLLVQLQTSPPPLRQIQCPMRPSPSGGGKGVVSVDRLLQANSPFSNSHGTRQDNYELQNSIGNTHFTN